MGFTDNAVLTGLRNTHFGDVTMNYEQTRADRAEDRRSKLNVAGLDFYRRIMELAADDDDSGKLMHQVWDDTPWMVDTRKAWKLAFWRRNHLWIYMDWVCHRENAKVFL